MPQSGWLTAAATNGRWVDGQAVGDSSHTGTAHTWGQLTHRVRAAGHFLVAVVSLAGKVDATFHFLPAFKGCVLESCDKESQVQRGPADVPACKYLCEAPQPSAKRRIILLSVHSANSANQLRLGPFHPWKQGFKSFGTAISLGFSILIFPYSRLKAYSAFSTFLGQVLYMRKCPPAAPSDSIHTPSFSH